MAKINLTLQYDDLGVNATLEGQKAVLNIADILMVGGETRPERLISRDSDNNLRVGSDGKLYINPQTYLTQSDW